MALDAICLTAVLEELRGVLEGGRIDKVYQPSRDEIVLAVRGAGENVKLLLSASPNGPRLHLTREVRENPAQPPMFCMLLRKHLTGARFLRLEQPELERIVLLRLESTDELGDKVGRTLVLEAMGRRANLILLDGEDRIIDCVRRVEGDVATGQRAVMPGLFYRLPEPRPGLPPLLERELDFRSNGESRGEPLEEKLRRLRAAVGPQGFVPYGLVREDKLVDFTFLPILQYGPDTESRRYESFSRLLDDFYASRATAEKVGQRGADLQKAVGRVRDRVARRVAQQELEREATRDRERKRELGDILTSNLYALQKGMKTVRLTDYYDPEGREVDIPLDPLLTPQQNAAKYYKEYNKAKTAEVVLGEQVEKGRRELEYLDSVLEAITLSEGERDLAEIRQELTDTGYLRRGAKAAKRMKVAAKPMEFRSTAGLRISVGKNNTQNDLLTAKQAGKGDLWLHTQKIHGSHVILWTEGRAPDAGSIEEAAKLAAWFSQARDGKKVPVDYTPVKYVKKPAGAKPGMVVYTTYQTAYVDPDGELARRLRVK
ncbi:Rqc2 family fibronectin-binding protein [Intestinimonas butyriciproducens]|uniref:Rqc2 family fibronectin-binding protein n=1 Tax=Intestinimonas butyriciproducens TaxID=1297617 RepID=UPI00195F0368|nr:NFACT family protein [Intestinimonas butyriciproducens]MBM6975651.1 NFACT family protein [Intestinimonas butyriciproducens]